VAGRSGWTLHRMSYRGHPVVSQGAKTSAALVPSLTTDYKAFGVRFLAECVTEHGFRLSDRPRGCAFSAADWRRRSP
jgi:hypothetical protein